MITIIIITIVINININVLNSIKINPILIMWILNLLNLKLKQKCAYAFEAEMKVYLRCVGLR